MLESEAIQYCRVATINLAIKGIAVRRDFDCAQPTIGRVMSEVEARLCKNNDCHINNSS